MLRSLNDSRPVANTKPVRTRDYSVELQSSGPALLPAIYHNLHIVSLTLRGDRVIRRESRERQWTRLALGESSVQPAGPGEAIAWPLGAHCLYVHLHPRLVRRVGEQLLGVADLTLQSRSRLRDHVIRDIGFELHDVLAAGAPASARLVHDLIMALTHHVVSAYAAAAGPVLRAGTLPIEDVLDAFRDEVQSWDGVASLAARCGLTRSYFTRHIRAVTGLSPYAMVLGSRVEAAKHLLEQRQASLSEVAFTTGFADQAHLTRVFQRATGLTPARYRTARATVAR